MTLEVGRSGSLRYCLQQFQKLLGRIVYQIRPPDSRADAGYPEAFPLLKQG